MQRQFLPDTMARIYGIQSQSQHVCCIHERCIGSCGGGPPIPYSRGFIAPATGMEGWGHPISLSKHLRKYKYTKLEPEKGTIRLLRVHRAVYRNDALVCDLNTYQLDEAPDYAALSYCWGTGSNDRKIFLLPEGAVFHARGSLEEALKRFRTSVGFGELENREKEELLWAEAICINQEDDEEKNSQIMIMQDIYQKTNTVYVDLGQEPNGWYASYQLICTAAWRWRTRPGSATETETVPRQESVSMGALTGYPHRDYWRLFTSPWFTRTWIIQEIALARRACLMYGRFTFSWDLLEDSFNTLLLSFWQVLAHFPELAEGGAPILQSISNFMALSEIRKSVQSGQYDTLSIMERARNFEVTELKDKVFALSAMMTESDRRDLGNYSMSAEEVFTRLAVTLVKPGRTIDLLDLAGRQRQRRDNVRLSSWVPDWGTKFALDGPRKISTWFTRPIISTLPSSICAQVQDDNSLTIYAFLVDNLFVVQETPIEDPVAGDPRDGIKLAMSMVKSFHTQCTAVYPDPEEAFARLLNFEDTANNDALDEQTSTRNYTRLLKKLLDTSREELINIDPSNNGDELHEYRNKFRNCCWSRRFSITSKGYMALVPLVAEEGILSAFSGAGLSHKF